MPNSAHRGDLRHRSLLREVSSTFGSSPPASPHHSIGSERSSNARRRHRHDEHCHSSRNVYAKREPAANALASPPSDGAPLPLDVALQSFLRTLELSASELRDGERVLSDLARALDPLGLRVRVFGSWCTGLRIPSSDMDFVAILRDAAEATASTGNRSPVQRLAASIDNDSLTSRERSKVFGAALRTIAASLRLSRRFYINTLILHAKVPIVKARHADSRTEVDISFHKDGIISSQFLCEEMKKYRLARRLILLVKALVADWGLDDPSVGGLGSFPIAMMVLWFLRNEVSERYPTEYRMSCAVCLVGFLRFYGEEFGYSTNAIDYGNQRLFAKPPALELYIVNPVMRHKNCAAAARLFHSRVVPKFRETFKRLTDILKYEVSMSTVENTLFSLFGRSVEALGGKTQVQKIMRKKLVTPSTTEQNLWDPKTNFYVGDATN